ncbi:MAG: hypothetical protein ACYTXF_35920 [Nostoc sp.]
MVEGVEQFRANTWARCHRFIQWHHKQGTLKTQAIPQVQEPRTDIFRNLVLRPRSTYW